MLAIPLRLLRFDLYSFLKHCGLCEQAHCHPWTSILFLQNTRQLLAISSCLGCQFTWQSWCCLQLQSEFQQYHNQYSPRSSNLSSVQIESNYDVGCNFRRLFAKCKHGCLYRAQSDFHLIILLFSSSCLLSDLFALYTTLDSLFAIPFQNHIFFFR